MSFNNWIKNKEIHKKWESTHMLYGVPKERNLSLALESQVKINEESLNSKFTRMSIPIIRRLFNHVNLKGSLSPLDRWMEFNTNLDFNTYDLDKEAIELEKLVEEMANIINNEIQDQTMLIHGITYEDNKIKLNYSIED